MDLTAPSINIGAVLIATLLAMLVGFVYYHPRVAGAHWMRAIGHTDESVAAGPRPWVYPLLLVCAFVTASVLAGAAWLSFAFYGGSFLVNALVTALVLWAGFTAARVVVHDAFDPRGFRVTVHTLVNELLIVVAMALAIGAWPPAGV